MKNILKSCAIALLFIANISCENDDQTIASAKGGPELLTPIDGSTYVLTPENAQNEATTLVWNHADYDVQTEVTYEVQTAISGTNFENIQIAGTTTNRFMVLTVEQLNALALALGINPFEATDVDLRIKSSLGSNASLESYSNTIKITLTAYTTDLPKLWVVGGFLAASGYGNDWTPSSAVPLAASGFGETDFEGYVYFNSASFEFKFLPTNASFDGDYGDDGSFSNALVQEGETNCLGSGAGYYWVKADTEALTYSIQPTSWAITGAATPLGWPDNGVVDQDMTYNPSTKKWEIVIALTAGGNEFKFRANDDWAINYGDAGNDGILEFNNGSNLSVPASGTYLVELDLSNPRNYTWTATLQ